MLKDWVSSGRMPHAAALVARRGRVAWNGGYGEQAPGKALAADTIFRIYSMTKPVTAVAFMMLVEEGKLHLGMPVHKFLGEPWRKANMKVFAGGTKENPKLEPCRRTVTLFHLITHTAGLTYGFAGSEIVNPVAGMYQDVFGRISSGADKVEKRGEANGGKLKPASASAQADKAAAQPSKLQLMADTLAALPLCFQPGSKWHYGHHYEVLGRVVEVASGLPLNEFMQQRIFAPLGMRDTGFSVLEGQEHRLASIWLAGPDGNSIDITEPPRKKGDRREALATGGAGLLSTMGDYFRFAQCLLSGGAGPNGARILSRRTVEWMVTNHLSGGTDMFSISLPGYTEMNRPGVGFGLGFSVSLDPAKMAENVGVGTFGWAGLAGTFFYCDPVEELVVIFMTQVIGLNELEVPRRLLLSNVVSGAIVDGSVAPLGAAARSRL